MNFRQEFVTKYCNDHNGQIRWLRNAFFDEEGKIEAVVESLNKADVEVSRLRSIVEGEDCCWGNLCGGEDGLCPTCRQKAKMKEGV